MVQVTVILCNDGWCEIVGQRLALVRDALTYAHIRLD